MTFTHANLNLGFADSGMRVPKVVVGPTYACTSYCTEGTSGFRSLVEFSMSPNTYRELRMVHRTLGYTTHRNSHKSASCMMYKEEENYSPDCRIELAVPDLLLGEHAAQESWHSFIWRSSQPIAFCEDAKP